MCQTSNDIMVRYDTVAAAVAAGSSCLSLTLPPTTPTLFPSTSHGWRKKRGMTS